MSYKTDYMTLVKVFIEWHRKVRFHWRLLYDNHKNGVHLKFGGVRKTELPKSTEKPPFYMT